MQELLHECSVEAVDVDEGSGLDDRVFVEAGLDPGRDLEVGVLQDAVVLGLRARDREHQAGAEEHPFGRNAAR